MWMPSLASTAYCSPNFTTTNFNIIFLADAKKYVFLNRCYWKPFFFPVSERLSDIFSRFLGRDFRSRRKNTSCHLFFKAIYE